MDGKVSPVVLVASDDPFLLDEIVRYLEEVPHWRLAGSARTIDELLTTVADKSPDAVLISDRLARDLSAHPQAGSSKLVVVARNERAESMRAALKLGARGFVVWPHEKPELAQLVEQGLTAQRNARGSGTLTAVWSPKGGSGSTSVAAHLAYAISDVTSSCLLVDLDLDHGDVAAFLGADEETKSFSDLLRVADEITGAIVESVGVESHGFRSVLAPGIAGEQGLLKAADAVRILGSLLESSEHVVVDLPTGYSELAPAVAQDASHVVMVVTADILSLRRYREMARVLRSAGVGDDRTEIVLNLFARGDLTLADVEAAIGRRVTVSIRPDLSIYRSAGRAELSQSGKKALASLAERITGRRIPGRKSKSQAGAPA